MNTAASELVERLLAEAEAAERTRDRYNYRGNDRYPRSFPGPSWTRLNDRATALREAAKAILGQ